MRSSLGRSRTQHQSPPAGEAVSAQSALLANRCPPKTIRAPVTSCWRSVVCAIRSDCEPLSAQIHQSIRRLLLANQCPHNPFCMRTAVHQNPQETTFLGAASAYSHCFCGQSWCFLGRFFVPVRIICGDFLGFRAFRTLKFIHVEPTLPLATLWPHRGREARGGAPSLRVIILKGEGGNRVPACLWLPLCWQLFDVCQTFGSHVVWQVFGLACVIIALLAIPAPIFGMVWRGLALKLMFVAASFPHKHPAFAPGNPTKKKGLQGRSINANRGSLAMCAHICCRVPTSRAGGKTQHGCARRGGQWFGQPSYCTTA